MVSKNFSVKSRKDGNFLIIECKGHFDYDGYDKNKKKLESFTNEDDNNIIVELSKVTYLSSRGLGFLIALYNHAESCNGCVRLVGLKESIKTVFEKTGYLNIFDYYDSIDEAKVF